MKKRIFALLLAGLLAASMTSCFQGTSDPQDTKPGGQTLPSETGPSDTDPSAPITFTDVDETVYTVEENVKLLTEMDSVVGAVLIKTKVTEMRRVKYHDTWSVVEYLGQQYYVLTDSITNADLTGKNFTACADKTMYVTTDGLNIRQYASAKLDSLGTLSANETVTVIATGDGWSKIKFTDKNGQEAFGFVKSEYLSETEYVDPNKIDYSSYFTACDPYKIMYVTADTLTIRFNAHAESTEMGTLQKDAEVTVVALATIEASTWAKIRVVVPADKEGDPDDVFLYYVNAKYLSEIKGGVPVTLEGVIAQWPDLGFAKLDAATTMYISADSCWIRNTPEIIPQYITQGGKEVENPAFNGVGNRQKKDALSVVALGTEWAIFTVADKDTGEIGYYFVHRSVLTTNASGEPAPLSLEELLANNPGFTACETAGKTLYATQSVNCYASAKTSDNPAAVLASGTAVTLAATNELGNWYIIKTADGVYYFVGSQLFSETAPQG